MEENIEYKLKTFSLQILLHYRERIDALIEAGFFESRSQLMRFVLEAGLADLKDRKRLLKKSDNIINKLLKHFLKGGDKRWKSREMEISQL